MAANKTVADLRVKSAKVLERRELMGIPADWRQPTTAVFVPGTKYRLEVVFGNVSPPVTYPDEKFRKDVIVIHIDCKGFKIGSRFELQVRPTFYTTESFGTVVPPVAGWTSQINVPFAPSLDTNDGDGKVVAHFRFNGPQMPPRPITTWFWKIGIYASVRNRVWRNSVSSV